MPIPMQILTAVAFELVLIFLCILFDEWRNKKPDSPEPAVDEFDEWFVLIDGTPVALLKNPEDADMFWFTWEVVEVDGRLVPEDLWDYSNDKRRSFRHVRTSELNEHAFPGGTKPLETGRVLIRSLYRCQSIESNADQTRN
ncbi:hypothetical protein [Thalassoroseus pseudoceratinae]|uniref:hypothetical protein n=1 Tax=Thalassoroseus pseudoceratinae TaxID=2713176 RepID=UPI00142276B8|nr:hypothetical protein [Thalassoroseus pseudoceratinae]